MGATRVLSTEVTKAPQQQVPETARICQDTVPTAQLLGPIICHPPFHKPDSHLPFVTPKTRTMSGAGSGFVFDKQQCKPMVKAWYLTLTLSLLILQC
jgi:hypothetical protein